MNKPQLQIDPEQATRIVERLHKTALYPANSMDPIGQMLQAQAVLLQEIRHAQEPRDFFGDLVRFHQKFKIGYRGKPRSLPHELQKFRIETLQEELNEYIEAVGEDDLAKQFDALIDLMYFALGTVLLHGFPMREGWARVHEANMRKILANSDGSNSKRGFGQDVVKPPGWTPPVLDDLVGVVRPEPKVVTGVDLGGKDESVGHPINLE